MGEDVWGGGGGLGSGRWCKGGIREWERMCGGLRSGR